MPCPTLFYMLKDKTDKIIYIKALKRYETLSIDGFNEPMLHDYRVFSIYYYKYYFVEPYIILCLAENTETDCKSLDPLKYQNCLFNLHMVM